ncbi:MAG: hypothetical protein IT327_11055 [Anaerolineae bacterium]|nr:hypothetical protein [Anaerolineae bacterium]
MSEYGRYPPQLEEDWYEFREQAFKKIAIEWLQSNEIAYTDEKGEG